MAGEHSSLLLIADPGAPAEIAERLSDTYEQEQTRVREQKELLDVIERTTRPGDASLP